jgi:hypothetical protein
MVVGFPYLLIKSSLVLHIVPVSSDNSLDNGFLCSSIFCSLVSSLTLETEEHIVSVSIIDGIDWLFGIYLKTVVTSEKKGSLDELFFVGHIIEI